MLKSHKIWYLSCIWLLTVFTGLLFQLEKNKHGSKKSKSKEFDSPADLCSTLSRNTSLLYLHVPADSGPGLTSLAGFWTVTETQQCLQRQSVSVQKREQPADNCLPWRFGHWCCLEAAPHGCSHGSITPKENPLFKCIWLTLMTEKSSLRQHWDH